MLFLETKIIMDTLNRLASILPSINEDDSSSTATNEGGQRFRPIKNKVMEAEISNPESGGITWEQLLERLCEIFESDEVNIDEVKNKIYVS